MARRIVPLLPAVLVAGAWTAWAAADGGYFGSTWYPSGIALVVLLAVLLVAGGLRLPDSRALRVSLALMGAFVAWNYLSTLWGLTPGNAVEESNRLLMVFAAVACVALLRWDERSATVLLLAWVAGITALVAIDMVGAAAAGDEVPERFIAGRYLGPLGYPNATSAVCAMAMAPALLLASRPGAPAPLQVVLIGAAAFLLQYSLLPQSRAAVIGLVATAVIVLVFAVDRLRALGRLLIVGGAAALAAGPVFDVYSVGVDIYNGGKGSLPAALDDAAGAMALGVAVALAAGSILVCAERLAAPHRSVVRGVRLGVAGTTIVILLAGAAFAAANAGSIYDNVHERYTGSGSDSVDTGPRITASFTDKRSDYWRVALDVFAGRPVVGAGAGAYGDQYTERRDQDFTHNKYAHNFVLRALADTGLVGGLLLVGAVLALVLGLVAAWLRSEAGARTVAAGALAVLGYFAVHSSLDWVELFPALVVPAVSVPVVALAVAGGPGRVRDGTPGAATVAVAITVAAAAVVLLTLPYLSNRYVERATDNWRADPAGALQDLDRAASLNPLSAAPLVRKGTIAVSLRRYGVAREAFGEALDRQDGWYPHFQLALIAASEGRFRAARAEIRRTRALNPLDPFVLDARRRIRRGEHVDLAAFNSKIAVANSARFTTGGN